MSEVFNRYKKLKEKDKKKMYLFPVGKFYIFLDEDADKINEYVVLKKTPFCKETYKCGFPIDRLEEYMKVFHNHQLPIVLVEKEESKNIEEVLEYIKKVDLDKMTPLKALNLLYEIKVMLS